MLSALLLTLLVWTIIVVSFSHTFQGGFAYRLLKMYAGTTEEKQLWIMFNNVYCSPHNQGYLEDQNEDEDDEAEEDENNITQNPVIQKFLRYTLYDLILYVGETILAFLILFWHHNLWCLFIIGKNTAWIAFSHVIQEKIKERILIEKQKGPHAQLINVFSGWIFYVDRLSSFCSAIIWIWVLWKEKAFFPSIDLW